ncbi:MAG: hypothetical protein AB1631_07835 [Acidobacteriota bacterium]
MKRGDMFLTIINMIQAHRRVPWLVWVIVGLVFAGGLALFVYFLKRMKKSEQEAERELSLTPSSLFVSDEPLRDDIEEKALMPEPEIRAQPAEVEATDEGNEPTEIEVETPIITPVIEPQKMEIETPIIEPIIEPQKVELQTPSLEEPQPIETPAEEPARVEMVMEEAPVFDDEVWAALEEVKRETETAPLTSEPPRPSARIANQSMTEPLRAESKLARWEMPVIEPVTPREESATEERKPSVESPEREPQVASVSSVEAPHIEAVTTRVKPGSILGIPDEPSSAPLILGEPQRDASEAGITGLSGYGRVNESGGKWGTVTLTATVLFIAGLVFAYIQWPWFHEKVNSFLALFSGGEQAVTVEQPKSDLPRAQIFPARSQPEKNMAKARGAVYNISSEPLTGLSLEVILERGDGSSETRTVELKPNQLQPGQQAIYEFEYDGKQFTGYRISKLLSDSVEVKFIMPSRSQ